VSESVQRRGDEVHKRVADVNEDDIRILLRRTQRLVAAGLRTPSVRYESAHELLIFPWIDGTPGRSALREQLGQPLPDGACVPLSFMDAVFRILAGLHGAAGGELGLQPLDPWRRIDPRLRAQKGRWLYEARLLRVSLAATLATVSAGTQALPVPVHGDFHVGQLVFDATDGGAWLLDLDDLAVGAAESDVANFAAHVVTSDDLHQGDVFGAFAVLVRRLAARYERFASRPCDEDLLRLYGAAALLRRALKLSHQGLSESRLRILLKACEKLANAPLPRT